MPHDTADYGTEKWPIRMSALTALGMCPGFALLQDARMLDEPDIGGKAAHTGTAVGRMIELFHMGKDFHEAVAQTEVEKEVGTGPSGQPFPFADLAQARVWFQDYCEDPRNPQEIVVRESLEATVELTLLSNATGPIYLRGHIDQVRIDPTGGPWRLWDVKSSQRYTGQELLIHYAWQQAAYTIATGKKFDRPVLPGGIIAVSQYSTRQRDRTKKQPGTQNVFYPAPWTLDDCYDMLRNVVALVDQIRQGTVYQLPGSHCAWCPAEMPHLCGDHLSERLC